MNVECNWINCGHSFYSSNLLLFFSRIFHSVTLFIVNVYFWNYIWNFINNFFLLDETMAELVNGSLKFFIRQNVWTRSWFYKRVTNAFRGQDVRVVSSTLPFNTAAAVRSPFIVHRSPCPALISFHCFNPFLSRLYSYGQQLTSPLILNTTTGQLYTDW